MTTPPFPDWTSNASDARFSDPAACALRAGRFAMQIRIRNFVEYAAGVLVVILFSGMAFAGFSRGEHLIGISGVLTIIGAFVVMWNLYRRASLIEPRPETACIDHLRSQYQRQYEALRSVPVWYLGPLVPGVIVFLFGTASGYAETVGWARALEGIWTTALILVAVFAGIAALNWIAARNLKSRIEALDKLA